LIDTLYHYRGSAYLLHEFVVMPDHIHVLITPKTSLERAVQFIKGGFSYRAKKELGSNMEVWQKEFSDNRIRDAADYRRHVFYIRLNPVRKHLSERAEGYPYSSASACIELDPVPQGLKPESFVESATARLKGVPFQRNTSDGVVEAAPFQSNTSCGAVEASSVLNHASNGAAEAARLQNTEPYGAAEGAPAQSERYRNAASGSTTDQAKANARKGPRSESDENKLAQDRVGKTA
jgi:putative transposase